MCVFCCFFFGSICEAYFKKRPEQIGYDILMTCDFDLCICYIFFIFYAFLIVDYLSQCLKFDKFCCIST